jgi:hypothetical protein
VLDDQDSTVESSSILGLGKGLVVRWRDGRAEPFTDKTFATVEDAAGARLRTDSDIFNLTRTLAPPDPMNLPRRFAKVVADRDRVFAVIVNGTTALAGLDRSTGHVLFLVPVSLGSVWTLQLEGGLPVIQSRFAHRWEVTIHDPATGGVRYRGERPRVRGRM